MSRTPWLNRRQLRSHLDEEAVGLVFPRLARIRVLSARIVRAVIRTAQEEVGIIS
jgi:hypothetical protein